MSTQNVEQLMRTAVVQHQSGNFAAAGDLYRQVLAQQPKHADALHLLGVLAGQAGQHDQAADLISRAITISSRNPTFYNNLGFSLLYLSRLDEAVAAYQRSLQYQPNNPEAHYYIANVAFNKGQLNEAINSYQRAISLRPNYFEAFHNLSTALITAKQYEMAIAIGQRAAALHPTYAPVYNNLGNALKYKGNLPAAIENYQRAVSLDPNFAEAYNNLGNTLQDAKEYEKAVAVYEKAVALQPGNAEFICNLGSALLNCEELDRAIDIMNRALAINPNDPKVIYNLAIAYTEKEEYARSIELHEKAVSLQPEYYDALLNLGAVYVQQSQYDKGFACLTQALRLKPDSPEALNNLGTVYKERGDLSGAIQLHQRALQLKPDLIKAYTNLALAWKEKGQLDEALETFQKGLELQPDYLDLIAGMGGVYQDMGQLDKTLERYRKTLELDPERMETHQGLLFALLYHTTANHEVVRAEHERWYQLHAAKFSEGVKPFSNDPDPVRRIRIGYVSGDFRRHSVNHFMQPILTRHDPQSVEVYCYANVRKPDAVTEMLKTCVAGWRDIVGKTDDEVADQIRDDQIDILIDLAGHTGDSRLKLFARKPAPVQATYLGYPATTGIATIDYRITDLYADPLGMTESQCSETLVRLPKTAWVYQPPVDAPQPAPSPAVESGAITFGSLNYFAKLSDLILDCYMRILAAVPNAKLIIKSKGLTSSGSSRRLELFRDRHGIAEDRVMLIDWIPEAEHYQHFGKLDIALDSYPYHGTTTTCETLWMGVPVVTLAGGSHVSRVGASLLTNMGLPQLVAQSPDDYVKVATELAGDIPRLADLRAGMRDRMRRSPLMDYPAMARNMEAIYRSIWQKWCQTK